MVSRVLKKMLGLLYRRVFPKLGAHEVPIMGSNDQPNVDFVTTWDARCGIAAYSAFLVAELRKTARLRIVQISSDHTFSPYYFVLGWQTGKAPGVIHVQHAYGMFGSLPIGRNKSLSAFTALLFYLGLARNNCLVVTTFHEVMRTVKAGGRVGLTYVKLLNKVICGVSDLIIVHTHESQELLQENYGVAKSKIRIIPMGCFENPVFLNKKECKEKLDLSGKKVMTIPGFVSRRKGHDLVLPLLPSLIPDVHLLIAGGKWSKEDAAFYEYLKKFVLDHNLGERVTFNDDFPISPVVMNATDIALLPYHVATDSMMLRDLVAYRVPIIASDLPPFKEVRNEYGCVELFRTDDSIDLLEKISSLLSDEKNQSFLRERCLKMWRERRWSVIAAEHAKSYLDVLSGHPDSIYEDKRQKERIDWLKNNASGRSLEIGCAGGFVTSYAGADVGLDINRWRLRSAKAKHHKQDFVAASAFSLPFKENAFDTVLIPEILEHVPIAQAGTIVQEAKRTSCKILITLPNADKIGYDKSLVENPEHKWFPTKKLVLGLMKDCRIQYSRENDFILVYWT